MKTNKQALFFALFIIISVYCWAGGNKDNGTATQAEQQTAPQTQTEQQTVPQSVQPPASLYWTGDGGKGKSITIMPPRGVRLAENQAAYLPDFVGNELVSNFKDFSAMTLFDRVNYQRQYDELLSGVYPDDDKASMGLGRDSSTDFMLLGDITRTSTGYALQLMVNSNDNKTTVATFSQTISIAELDNLTGVRRASLDLLQKMGVQLTERARTELTRAATADRVNAQTALAQGITAQRGGTVIEALSYYIQSVNYDPNLAEAASRMNILSANISSGNIGEDTRNDIAWRKQWVTLLQEAEIFYSNYNKGNQPYYLIYDTHIMQGNIEYQKETVELSFYMGLFPDTSWVNTINEVISTIKIGLQATGRAGAWGLDWPNKSVSTLTPFVDQENEYVIVTEILNSEGVSIGRRTNTLGYGNMNREGILTPFWTGGLVTFSAVDVNRITDQLSFRIVSINGLPVGSIASEKRISVMTVAEYNSISTVVDNGMNLENVYNFSYDDTGTKLTGYIGPPGRLIIPPIVNDFEPDPVFRLINTFSRKGITSVIIPSTFSALRGSPFINNRLTSITIGGGVYINDSPTIVSPTFDREFIRFYNNNGKKAGRYTHSGNAWNYSRQ